MTNRLRCTTARVVQRLVMHQWAFGWDRFAIVDLTIDTEKREHRSHLV